MGVGLSLLLRRHSTENDYEGEAGGKPQLVEGIIRNVSVDEKWQMIRYDQLAMHVLEVGCN